MKKLFSILLFGAMLAVFSACEQRTTTTEVYQIILVTDDLQGATATVSKTNDIHFADEVRVTVNPKKSHSWEIAPEVTASNAICKSSTEEDGVYTYVFTAFEDNSLIQVTGVAVPSNIDLNGHAYVDLGLPSGTLWATCNVGANNPEEYGDHVAWGEVNTKNRYDWITYKYSSDISSELTKYCTDSEYGKNGFTDNKTVLDPADDAATAKWGGDWRMPTSSEQQELLNECDWKWTENYNNTGVAGRIVTGKNGNSIFLPAAGRRVPSNPNLAGSLGSYWSSSLYEGNPRCAYSFYFNGDNNRDLSKNSERSLGKSVRPVCSPQ